MSQIDNLYNLLKDGKPHNTIEIMERVYGGDHLGLARVGARIWDIKKKYKVEIKSWPDEDKKSIWWYQIQVKTIFSYSELEIKKAREKVKVEKEKFEIKQLRLI